MQEAKLQFLLNDGTSSVRLTSTLSLWRLMVATKSNLTVVVHTVDICNGVCNRYLANTSLQFFSQSNSSWNDLPKSLTNSFLCFLHVAGAGVA